MRGITIDGVKIEICEGIDVEIEGGVVRIKAKPATEIRQHHYYPASDPHPVLPFIGWPPNWVYPYQPYSQPVHPLPTIICGDGTTSTTGKIASSVSSGSPYTVLSPLQ